ncbi:MAG TPA: helix-turn-helix domain-containing protein [Acidimicrobiia bacterium]|nr:helix-turn-helix domain-containing protein [Acidimicrobiia bacterium]
MDRLAVHKALGDPTRYAIYEELARSRQPRSVRELADALDLHPNTVRPHLDQMREVGLVDVDAVHRGTVGRPQHRYSLAPGAPNAGVEPPTHTLLAALLATLAERSGASIEDAVATGRTWGTEAVRRTPSKECAPLLLAELDRLGFEPASAQQGPCLDVAFQHCPFKELAEAYPELVCNLHRGIVEGIVGDRGMVEHFGALYDRDPCTVSVTIGVT